MSEESHTPPEQVLHPCDKINQDPRIQVIFIPIQTSLVSFLCFCEDIMQISFKYLIVDSRGYVLGSNSAIQCPKH